MLYRENNLNNKNEAVFIQESVLRSEKKQVDGIYTAVRRIAIIVKKMF